MLWICDMCGNRPHLCHAYDSALFNTKNHVCVCVYIRQTVTLHHRATSNVDKQPSIVRFYLDCRSLSRRGIMAVKWQCTVARLSHIIEFTRRRHIVRDSGPWTARQPGGGGARRTRAWPFCRAAVADVFPKGTEMAS